MTADTSAHPTLRAALADVRQQVAELLGDIDTRVRPKPDRIETSRQLPGPVWEPLEAWTVRVIDPDETDASVFIAHPHLWDDDIIPLDPINARRVGMAFLAAADWADRIRTRELDTGQPANHPETP
jgi:hypothetical protein